jgi:hypothetical protein
MVGRHGWLNLHYSRGLGRSSHPGELLRQYHLLQP